MIYEPRSVGDTGYRTRTGSKVLMEAFELLIPEIRHLIDVPPELAAMGQTMRGLLDGDWTPTFKGMSLVDQAALAVPMMNAFRLTVEPYVNSDDPIPAEVLAVSETVARLMGEVDSKVAWVAIRNSMAWESTNRATQGSDPYEWQSLVQRFVAKSTAWMAVFSNIRNKHISTLH